MQLTDFEYEILVNDDGSTDGTTEKLLEYQTKYPDKVRVITHDINEWSQGKHNLIRDNLLAFANGRYFALCEGDDYWIDAGKLQKQYDAMRQNENAVLCVHASQNIEATTRRMVSLNKPFESNVIVPVSFLIQEIHPFATNSFFIEANAYRNYQNDTDFVDLPAHGDHKMQIYFATHGDVIYLSDLMSVYRVRAKGSINASHRHDELFWQKVSEDRCHMLMVADKMDKKRHHEDFEMAIRKSQYGCLIAARKFRDVLKKYPDMVSKEPWSRRIKLALGAAFPKLGAWTANVLGK